MVGTTGWIIGNYELNPKPIGHGSFGTIYNARRVSDGLAVAFKLVVLTDDPDSRNKLAAERRGATLQDRFEKAHGMVPTVYSYGTHDDDFYIAMELVEGGALANLIAAGPLAPVAAAGYAVRICDFLEKAHQFETTIEGEHYARIVHADLKPQHILITRDGRIKVLDFGIAKALASERPLTVNSWVTVDYASPEHLDSGYVNEHDDFWAVGVMLYEMVSGHRPYSALDAVDDRRRTRLQRAIMNNAPREALPWSCPTALAAIINKLLAYQVDRRYPTAAAIKADLEAFVGGREPAAAKEYLAPPTMPIRPASIAPAPVPSAGVVPPTDPLPIPTVAGGGVAVADAAVPSTAVSRRVRGGAIRRIAWLVFLFALVSVVAREGVAAIAAERFRGRLDMLDGRSVTQFKQDYERIRGWSPLRVGLRLRVRPLLKPRLQTIAEAVIADYRREVPTVTAAGWRQANEALRWALELSPRDTVLRSKQLDCEGHVLRVTAQSQPRGPAQRQAYLSAIETFRRAATLNPESFDPYLGIASTEVYGLDRVDEAAAAITEAINRGYLAGRREQAELGDGYLRRADRSRRLAARMTGDQHRRELESAQADYARCITSFDSIVGFGRAAENLELCKRRGEAVRSDLESAIEIQ